MFSAGVSANLEFRMLDRWVRWAFVYDLKLKPNKVGAPNIELATVLDLLHARVEAGEAVQLLNNETAAIRIQNFRFNNNRTRAAFLFNYSDTNISDPVFGELSSGRLRLEPKLEGEGVAVSAHMVVSLVPDPVSGTYLAALEDIPGVGRSRLTPFLTHEFRAVSDFRFRDTDNKIKDYRMVPELLGLPSQSLRSDLDRGELSGFELVRMTRAAGEFDEDNIIEEQTRTVKLKVKNHYTGLDALNVVNRLKDRAGHQGYDLIKVRF